VVDVVASSPAGTAGLLVGDVVVAVDGSPISGQAALIATIRDHRPGDSLTIDVRRKGAPLTLTAVLVDRPAG
jgi:S1-C subfamily serine protease